MEEYNLVYILIFLIFLLFIFILFSKNNRKHKSSFIKKEELIKNYEYEMLTLIEKYEKDKKILQEKKIEFLKKASLELHRNIFFDEHEAKAVIKNLASL